MVIGGMSKSGESGRASLLRGPPDAAAAIICQVRAEAGPQRTICRLSARVTGNAGEFSWHAVPSEESACAELRARGNGLTARLCARALDDDVVELSLRIQPDPDDGQLRTISCCRIEVDFLPDGRALGREDPLDDCHVPHLVPQPGLVIADMVFRSPALLVRRAEFALALLPDLARLAQSRPAPWALDFDRDGPLTTPRLALAMVHHSLDHHVYFRAEPTREIQIPAGGIELACELIATGRATSDFTRNVQRRLWQQHGESLYRAGRPQVLPLDEAAREAMRRLFSRGDLYFEFEREGRRYGGIAAHACTTKRQLRPLGARATRVASPIHGFGISLWLRALGAFNLSRRGDDFLRWSLSNLGIPYIAETQFTAWFNALRTAYGARVLAEKWRDERLMEQAGLIKELALSAPLDDGIFAAVCTHPEGKLWWHRGTLAFKPIGDYHTPDQATTGYVMARWYRDIERDPRLLERARGLAGFFARHQLPSGAVPAWIEGRRHQPLPRLRESASTAGPLMFMAQLAALDEDERWLDSARRMAEFIEEHVLPDHRWYDYETFYSCSKQRRPARDPRSGVLPQNTQCKWWAAEGMRLLAEITGEDHYVELLQRCLDDLLWHQQIWDAPYLSIDTFGGFGSMNTDAEWNDARQGCIAPVLMDSYGVTGDPQHFQRGVAALRACYTTLLHPAMREWAPGNMAHYREEDRGAIYENYAHLGFDRVCAGYLEPDWGAGTAAWATAHAWQFYGDVFAPAPVSGDGASRASPL